MDFLFKAISAACELILGFDPEVWLIVWTSLKVSVVASLLAATVGVPLAMAIALGRFRLRGLVLLVLNTSMAMPTVVVGLFLYNVLARRGPMGELELLYTPAGIILGEFILALPIVTALTISAVSALDPRLLLTCKSLGASARQQAWIILREGRFGITAAVVAAFGRLIGEVGIAMMIGGNVRGLTRTMTTAIALETSKGDLPLALGLGMILLLLSLAINGGAYMLGDMARRRRG